MLSFYMNKPILIVLVIRLNVKGLESEKYDSDDFSLSSNT